MNITYDMTTKEEDTQKLIVDGAEKDVKRMKYIFTPNHSLTEKHFFLGDHHTDWEFEECKNIWIKRFYDEWLVEAGYDTLYYQVDVSSGLISEKAIKLLNVLQPSIDDCLNEILQKKI